MERSHIHTTSTMLLHIHTAYATLMLAMLANGDSLSTLSNFLSAERKFSPNKVLNTSNHLHEVTVTLMKYN